MTWVWCYHVWQVLSAWQDWREQRVTVPEGGAADGWARSSFTASEPSSSSSLTMHVPLVSLFIKRGYLRWEPLHVLCFLFFFYYLNFNQFAILNKVLDGVLSHQLLSIYYFLLFLTFGQITDELSWWQQFFVCCPLVTWTAIIQRHHSCLAAPWSSLDSLESLTDEYSNTLCVPLLQDFKFPLTVVIVHLFMKFVLAGLCRAVYTLVTGVPRVMLAWDVYWRKVLPPGAAAGLDIGLSQWSLEFITVAL